MIVLTPERYERMLEMIWKIGRSKRYRLMALFVRQYGLEYDKTRTDFEHIGCQLSAGEAARRQQAGLAQEAKKR